MGDRCIRCGLVEGGEWWEGCGGSETFVMLTRLVVLLSLSGAFSFSIRGQTALLQQHGNLHTLITNLWVNFFKVMIPFVSIFSFLEFALTCLDIPGWDGVGASSRNVTQQVSYSVRNCFSPTMSRTCLWLKTGYQFRIIFFKIWMAFWLVLENWMSWIEFSIRNCDWSDLHKKKLQIDVYI